MKALRRLIVLAVLALVAPSLHAQSESGFQGRLGLGSSFSPQTWLLAGTLEYRPDPFFAFGPSVLWGLGSLTDYFVPTFGGRLILPKEFFNPSASVPGIDLFLQAGGGVAFRETSGFRKTDFTYQIGLGADVFLSQHFCLGLQTNINFVGEEVEESFTSLLGTLGFRF